MRAQRLSRSLLVVALLASPAAAMRIAAGTATVAPSGARGELITLPAQLGRELLARPLHERIVVSDWPIAPAERGTLLLEREEVYAPDAHIVTVGPSGPVEVPRSPLVFWKGEVLEQPSTRVMLSFDPTSGEFGGYVNRPQGSERIARVAGEADGYLLANPDDFRAAGSPELTWSCGQQSSAALDPLPVTPTDATGPTKSLRLIKAAVIAVDTDNELLLHKFGNDTTQAVNYIANLFAAMNVIYERDLAVHLLQGTTFLRPSTALDPYVQPCGSGVTDCTASLAADGGMLNELTSYWSSGCAGQCSGVQRAATMFLSGKQSGNFSASGIAWLDTLCSNANAYSVNQVFKFATDTSSNDILITAHEIGHNFGSQHTHCTGIDQCYNLEACYGGPTACPVAATYSGVPNVTGTLMSYCHLSGLPGCTSSPVFHTGTIAILTPKIAARVGSCINTVLWDDGLESGIAPWDGHAP